MSADDKGQAAGLAAMMAALRVFNEERDWAKFHSPRNLAMALSVEAGELLELFLWCRDDEVQPAHGREQRLAEELADVLISTLNLFERCGIDPLQAFENKLAINARRYPAHLVRGSCKKYDEYLQGPETSKGAEG